MDLCGPAEKIRRKIKRRGIDGLLVTGGADRRYVSGFSGSFGAAFITRAGDYLLTDSRYQEQAAAECPGFAVINPGKNLPRAIGQIMGKEGLGSAGFDPVSMTHAFYLRLEEAAAPAMLVPAEGFVRRLRAVKSEREIALIRKACRAADRAMLMLRRAIRPGVSEMDIEAELVYFLKKEARAGLAFRPVITSGNRTSLPHGMPSGRKIKKGDMVMLDFGAEVEGYRSDLTRTFCVGRMSPGQKSLYETVLSNQAMSIGMLAPGVAAGRVFGLSRSGLREAGYDLVHGLGHGVGLEVHELPALAGGSGMRLKENMVFTVEPGVYLPGRCGVRIEDVVLLKGGGAEILSRTSKRRNII